MTSSDGIETQQLTAGQLPLTVSRPAGTPRGGLIVVQEAFGVTPHITDVTVRAAAAGYLAVAPHLFHRSGDPVLDYSDTEHIRPAMDALTAQSLTEDVDGSIAFLEEAGLAPVQIGIVGFCMGGSVTLFTAATHTLGAAVTFYGGGVSTPRFGIRPLIEYASSLTTPWLGLYGALDKSIPVAEVESLKAEAAKAAVPTKVVLYEGADHGFHCDHRPAVFNPEAAADGWSRALAWFAKHLAS